MLRDGYCRALQLYVKWFGPGLWRMLLFRYGRTRLSVSPLPGAEEGNWLREAERLVQSHRAWIQTQVHWTLELWYNVSQKGAWSPPLSSKIVPPVLSIVSATRIEKIHR